MFDFNVDQPNTARKLVDKGILFPSHQETNENQVHILDIEILIVIYRYMDINIVDIDSCYW